MIPLAMLLYVRGIYKTFITTKSARVAECACVCVCVFVCLDMQSVMANFADFFCKCLLSLAKLNERGRAEGGNKTCTYVYLCTYRHDVCVHCCFIYAAISNSILRLVTMPVTYCIIKEASGDVIGR